MVATGLTLYCVYLASDLTTFGLDVYGFGMLIGARHSSIASPLILGALLRLQLARPLGGALQHIL